MSFLHLTLLLHILIETPAAINFFLRPSSTLIVVQPHAHPIIRQYALLLMLTNVLAAFCLAGWIDNEVGRKIGGVLAIYHIGPIIRAAFSLRRKSGIHLKSRGTTSGLANTRDQPNTTGGGISTLGGPLLHLIIHSACFLGLSIATLGPS